jgi:EAL domain-containing protein (putative c-di-GMP-specific phosphodiesterase class I)/CHASE2 domain-containing sensor protein
MPAGDLGLAARLLARQRALVFGAAALLGLLTLATGAAGLFDDFLRKTRDSIRSHPASGEVHVVEIDARSLAKIDRWPWPRSVHAAAIDRLHRAGARSIAFDVDFSATSEPAEDKALASALMRAERSVILPTLRQHAGSGSSEIVDMVPAKPFAENAFLASVNVVPDADGYVRRMLLGVETKGVPRPSLASMLAEKRAVIGRDFEIDYSIEPGSIPRHSMVDLVEGRVPPHVLAGKRVVIGATAVEIWDRYAVPRHGVVPGVIIQALAVETLLAGPVPTRASGLWPLLIALAGVLNAVRPGARPRRFAVFALTSGLVLTLPLITEEALAVTLPIGPAMLAMFAAAAVASGYLVVEARRSIVDPDTGLPNLRALAKAAGERGAASNVVVARIDRFAAIASSLGPAATASLVNRVADRLRFAHDEKVVYRIDDASLAWLERTGDEASLEDRVEAIAALMRAPVECGRLIDVSLTFGLATDAAGGDPQQLVANASLAAFHAAQRGCRWQRFTEADGETANWHLSLMAELDHAMATAQLWNAYQPKLDIATGRVIGAEALVRWLHPERGPIEPDSFIPLIEEHGRARDLTTHVLEQAIEDALFWKNAGYPIGVAVNVSATLLADHEFIETVGQILQGSQVPTSQVTIEVTESAAMDSPDRAIAALESWRAHGVNISIDDYGTGQSSLGYLQKLPATELKIDKSFVQTIGSDPRNAIMVRSTIALAHELGMKVVAEGIEDTDCLRLLSEMGCDTAQGYLIGRPMPADGIAEFLAESRSAAAA